MTQVATFNCGAIHAWLPTHLVQETNFITVAGNNIKQTKAMFCFGSFLK